MRANGEVLPEPQVSIHLPGRPWQDCHPAAGGRGHLVVLLEPWAAIALCRSDVPGWIAEQAHSLAHDDDEAALGRLRDLFGEAGLSMPAEDVLEFGQRVFDSAGRGRVGREPGAGTRAFRRSFRQTFGMAPKVWARLSRFSADLKWLHAHPWTGRDQDEPDHFDQSHRIREFRAWAGMTPGAYARLTRGTSRVWSTPLPLTLS